MNTIPSLRRAAAVATTAILAVAGLAVPSAASARPAADTGSAPVGITSQAAKALVERLGADRTGGAWVDGSGRMVVAVTDAAAEKTVVSAGGIAQRVTRSTAELNAINATLGTQIATPGVAFGVDSMNNRLFIDADTTVSAEEYQRLADLAASHGGAVTLRRMRGELKPFIQGGRFITPNRGSEYGSCSVGFNVRKKDNPNSLYMITAGHCTVGASGVSDWYDGVGQYVGYDAGGNFPGNDFGLIKHNNANLSKPGNVWISEGVVRDITHSRDAGLGETVCHSGWKTGYRCGEVLARNTTANYAEGRVTGLDYTSFCAAGGDSGGSVFHGDAALGLVSGGIPEDCRTYVQPLNEALAWYDVEVY
ncbi:S1 family peptidase [Micromonospora sp. KC213]|uniref:S1 family peptidase n=1 Tax=Micromonospora sp. KC213 TaxID=2530378 RepID=UPI001046459D|nr:S1 family peptidase [Micromonospora sp. KC213]TDC42839.1 trypsin-like serine protease [Micromonospora sp. KC213]